MPHPAWRKQTLLLSVLILAGCGGSSAPKAQVIAGPGFRFQAPAGWKVDRTPRQVSATRGSELVQVSTFPLVKPYRPALFERVATELAARMEQVAKRVSGTVTGHRIVTSAGIRSWNYEVKAGDDVDQYTFVLRGLREYLLLCRRHSSSSTAACDQLISGFKLV
jgi:predicted Zn-dependent protease